MDTEHDRLSLIFALGGVYVLAGDGQFIAAFDREYAESIDIEGRVPLLHCRSSDVERLSLKKGVLVTVGDESFRVKRHEPDGTGMSRLILE